MNTLTMPFTYVRSFVHKVTAFVKFTVESIVDKCRSIICKSEFSKVNTEEQNDVTCAGDTGCTGCGNAIYTVSEDHNSEQVQEV